MTTGALSGITVLDLSRLLPGPWCTMMLADHGARVIALENPRYASQGAFPDLINRNKEHMGLNLKSDTGKKIFLELASRADVIVEGFRPGVTHRLGVGYDHVKAVNPGIVYCSITGYGQTGPHRDTPGHDINYLSMAGALDLIGSKEAPCAPGFQIADIAGGSLSAVSGILLALFHRERTGQGQHIDISITDGTLALMHLALNLQQETGQTATRCDTLLSHRYAFYNTYETADHKFIALGALEPKFWTAFCRATGLEHFEALQFDDEKRHEIIQTVRDLIKSHPLSHWAHRFKDLDPCWSPVKTLSEAMDSKLFQEREMAVACQNRHGEPVQTIGVPVKLSHTPGSIRTPPFSFGQDTDKLLTELGYAQEEIQALKAAGIT
ncbi:CaiB/BaiF CoA transferase family protein [Desulfoluna spongiiphila]|uniref:Crotonobetainyl-CoA:carnitine CoA-transferase CaiB n=1 Tax=Desulfoluna spongiiphila TaxID=419481 RepID=A0A1G5ARF7_9BACT|nr:CaiB/BaiF CoA-transferase family protein [Desulfoluna spongiiphila]SCX80457.1 Crotonobetainyl-CoA:carnitine CoA-transferase CaiB [Desulfoluna spongiiphila]